jgi:sugar/nucleoside kinase (ribokinase family)
VTGRLIHPGQVLLDLVMQVPALPPPGGDVVATGTALTPGGGYNVVAAAARAGAGVVYAGRHGAGRFGDTVRAALAAEGITVALPPGEHDTGICVVLVDPSGERTFVTGTGATEGASPAELAAVPVTASDVVHLSGYALLDAVRARELLGWHGFAAGATVLLDPGPLAAEIDDATWAAALARTTVLSCNAREAALLTGTTDLRAASHLLAGRLGHDAAVVVRDGGAGCLVTTGGTTTAVPGFAVTAVDTTGAGDTHCGVLAAELLRRTDPGRPDPGRPDLGGSGLPAAARRANAAAALSVTRRGPATAPTRAEVDALLGDVADGYATAR